VSKRQTPYPIDNPLGSASPIGLAKSCLREFIHWYKKSDSSTISSVRNGFNPVQSQLERAVNLLNKLDQRRFQIIVFGLVSRGKSSVLNALLERNVMETGPFHGVTRDISTISWFLPQPDSGFSVELVDTPGLDEIEDGGRGQLSMEFAAQADLVLLITAGDLTRTEYQAMADLYRMSKPVLLVFNKVDLYPSADYQVIVKRLQKLLHESIPDPSSTPDGRKPTSSFIPSFQFTEANIVGVAADPKPIQVRVEWCDGRITNEWETPPPQIDNLRQTILTVLNRHGEWLITLNTLTQTRDIQQDLARQSVALHRQEASDLIWRFVWTKSMIVGLNPIIGLDLLGGLLCDLALIRALAKLYHLPMTNYQAGRLLKQILLSMGALVLGELSSQVIWGLGKTLGTLASVFESPLNLGTYGGSFGMQAILAGLGTYRVGLTAQLYLEQGCSWGDAGANTVLNRLFR
jgi:small GTP-binding protein